MTFYRASGRAYELGAPLGAVPTIAATAESDDIAAEAAKAFEGGVSRRPSPGQSTVDNINESVNNWFNTGFKWLGDNLVQPVMANTRAATRQLDADIDRLDRDEDGRTTGREGGVQALGAGFTFLANVVGMRAIPGLDNVDYLEKFYRPEYKAGVEGKAASVGQIVIAEGHGNEEMKQATSIDSYDDDALFRIRQNYFNQGGYRLASGAIDVVVGVVMDPANILVPGAAGVVKGLTKITPEAVKAASAAGRGARLADPTNDVARRVASAEDTMQPMQVDEILPPDADPAMQAARNQEEFGAGVIEDPNASTLDEPMEGDDLLDVDPETLYEEPEAGGAHRWDGDGAETFDEGLVDEAGDPLPDGTWSPAETESKGDTVWDRLRGGTLRHNVEATTDYYLNRISQVAGGKGDLADVRNELYNDKILGQTAERNAITDLMIDIGSRHADDNVRRGLMDDVLYAAAGDLPALKRIKNTDEILGQELARELGQDRLQARRMAISSNTLTPDEKMRVMESDADEAELTALYDKIVREDLDEIPGQVKRLEFDVEHGATDLAIGVHPIRGALGGTYAMFSPIGRTSFVRVGRRLPVVHMFVDKHIPGAITLADRETESLGDQYMRDAIRDTIGKKGEGSEQLQEFRERLYRAPQAGLGDEEEILDNQLQTLTEFNIAMANTVADDVTERIIKSGKFGYGADAAPEVQEKVRLWATAAVQERSRELSAVRQRLYDNAQSDGSLVMIGPDGQRYGAGVNMVDNFKKGHGRIGVAAIDWKRLRNDLVHHFDPDDHSMEDIVDLLKSKPNQTWRSTQIPEDILREDAAYHNRRKIGNWVGGAADTMLNLWKFAALFRPAYAMRNQIDSQVRQIIDGGFWDRMATSLRGATNFTGNLRRVSELDAQIINTYVRADDEYFALLDLAKPYLLPDGSLAANTPKRLTEAFRVTQARMNATVDDYRKAVASLGGDGEVPELLRGTDLAGWKRARTSTALRHGGKLIRDTPVKRIQGSSRAVKGGKYTPTDRLRDAYWGGDVDIRRTILKDSDASTMGHALAGARARYNQILTGQQWGDKVTSTIDYMPETAGLWTQQYVKIINDGVRKDPVTKALLGGTDQRKILTWLKDTEDGKAYYHAKATTRNDTLRYEDEEDFLNSTVEALGDLVPGTARSRNMIAARDLKPEDVDDIFWGRNARPTLPDEYETIRADLGRGSFVSKYQNFRQAYFHWAAAMPETYLAKHPVFVRSYQGEMERMLKRVENPDALSAADQVALHKKAALNARKRVAAVMFDNAHPSQFANKMRFIMPFYQAWEDVMVKYPRIIASGPGQALRAWNGIKGWQRGVPAMATVEDDNGNRIMPDGSLWTQDADGNLVEKIGQAAEPNLGKIMFALPAWAPFVGGKTLSIKRGSLNAIFQGEGQEIFFPGVSPAVQWPVNEMYVKFAPTAEGAKAVEWMKNNPAAAMVFDRILPFGVSGYGTPGARALDAVIPAHFDAVANWMGKEGNARFDTLASSNAVSLLHSMRENPDLADQFDTEEAFQAEVVRRTKQDLALEMWSAGIGPAKVTAESELEWYLDEYRRMRNDPDVARIERETGVSARDQFHIKYPDFREVTLSTTLTSTGVEYEASDVAEAQKWRATIRQAATNGVSLGWLLAGGALDDGSKFDENAYAVARSTGIASEKDTSIAATRLGAEEELAWGELERIKAMRDDGVMQIEEVGGDTAPVEQWYQAKVSDLVKQYPNWGSKFEAGGFADRTAQFLHESAKALGAVIDNGQLVDWNPPSQAHGRADLAILQKFIIERERVIDLMNKNGIGSLNNQDAGGVAQFWEGRLNEYRQDPAMARIINRYGLDEDDLSAKIGAKVNNG